MATFDELLDDWRESMRGLIRQGWTGEMTVPAPVQIWGTLPSGEKFYFRARHDEVSLAVGGEDPADGAPWRRVVTYGSGSDASYLSAEDGVPILLALYEEWKGRPE
jgi:hypothetical protein